MGLARFRRRRLEGDEDAERGDADHDFGEADMRRLNIKRGPPIEDPEKTKPHLKSV